MERSLPSLVDAQYATEDQWKNNSRKDEGMELKQKNTCLLKAYLKYWNLKEDYKNHCNIFFMALIIIAIS